MPASNVQCVAQGKTASVDQPSKPGLVLGFVRALGSGPAAPKPPLPRVPPASASLPRDSARRELRRTSSVASHAASVQAASPRQSQAAEAPKKKKKSPHDEVYDPCAIHESSLGLFKGVKKLSVRLHCVAAVMLLVTRLADNSSCLAAHLEAIYHAASCLFRPVQTFTSTSKYAAA